jgi:hypothetical protein
MARDKDEIEKCTKWAEIQCHQICTHASHENPTTWKMCRNSTLHINEMIVVMNPDMKEALPAKFDRETFERKSIPIVGGKFPVDHAFRQELRSTANELFARRGVSSLPIQFSPIQTHSNFVRQLMNYLHEEESQAYPFNFRKRKSLNINVDSMLARRSAEEAEMLVRRAEREAKMLARREKHANRAATAAEKPELAHRAAAAAETPASRPAPGAPPPPRAAAAIPLPPSRPPS